MACVEPIREIDKINLIKQILKKNGRRNYLLFVMGINCGLRISDILKLKISDVKNKNYIELIEQKTKKSKKILITNSYKKDLEEYIYYKKPNEWLFPSQKGNKPISRVQAYRIICNACSAVGITASIGTHTLRKTFGYHFYNKTKDIALLQNMLNHSAPSITMRYVGINQDIIDANLKEFAL